MKSPLGRCNPFLPLVVLYGGCTTPVVAPASPAAVMLGEWSYSSPQALRASPALNTGLRVQIRIDSLDGMRFSGHVTLWFAGDVGIASSAFGPVSGTVDDTNGVTMVIPREPTVSRPLLVMGEVTDDVLTVRDCSVGTEPGPFAPGSAFRRLQSGGPNQ